MAVALPIEAVAASADIMFILLFIQVNWTVIRMRKTHPDLPRTFEVPYMPYPSLIGIVLQFVLLPFLVYELGLEPGLTGQSSHEFVALLTTVIWMGLGLAVYYGYSKQQKAEQIEEDPPTLVTEQSPIQANHQIVVPIANPESASQLMQTAVSLANDRNGEILVMSAVTVPQQTPLDQGRQFIDDERETLTEAMQIAENADVPVSGTIRIGHSVSKAILNTIDQYECETVLMGWKGRRKSQRRDIVLGSNVDTVAQEADCDVLIKRIGPDADDSADSILLPTAGGPHAEYAAEIASSLATANGGHIDIIHVIDPTADESERNDAAELLEETAANIDTTTAVETQLIEGSNVVETVVDYSEGYDVTLVGATREGLFQQFVFGSVPEQIGWNAKNTVIMAKRHISITSVITRLLGRGT